MTGKMKQAKLLVLLVKEKNDSTNTFFYVGSMIVRFQSMVTEAIKDCPGTQILAWKVKTW